MSDTKYVVPEGLIDEILVTLRPVYTQPGELTRIVESVITWLAENPTPPTQTDLIVLSDVSFRAGEDRNEVVKQVVMEWQRRRFLPSGEPKEVRDLFWSTQCSSSVVDKQIAELDAAHDLDVIEAFKRGQKSVIIT